jgi:hypothetical protein
MKSRQWQEKPLEELREHVRGPALRAAVDAMAAACADRSEWRMLTGCLGSEMRLQFQDSTTHEVLVWLRLTQRKIVLCLPDRTLARIPGAPQSLRAVSSGMRQAAGVCEVGVGDPLQAQLLAALVFSTEGPAVDQAREAALRRQKDLTEAERLQLLEARHGQGVFRERVEVVEARCRVCGVLDRRQLRAVHIKPWRDCSSAEMLDAHNGLLLSPHVAHLFERGHISFADKGELLVSRFLNAAVLDAWAIRQPLNCGAFQPAQCQYLAYHRHWVFEQGQGGRRSGSAASGSTSQPTEQATSQVA